MRLFARSGFVRSVLNVCRSSVNKNANCFRKSTLLLTKKHKPARYHLEAACFYSTEGKKSFIDQKVEGIKDAIELKKEKLEQKFRLKGEEIVKDFIYQKDVTGERLRLKKESVIKDILEAKSKVKYRIEDVVEKEKILTIPNVLCVTRIAMTPYLGYVILQNQYHLAFALLVFAGITDMLDGWIARKWKGQSSRIGSFLDPLADKVLISTLFVTLTWQNLIPLQLTLLIVSRDVALVIAGFVIRYKSLPPPRTLSRYFDATNATAQLAPTFVSKVNTAVQLILVGTTLASPVFGYVDHPALQVLFGVTAVSTVVSAVSYIVSKDTYKFLKTKSNNSTKL